VAAILRPPPRNSYAYPGYRSGESLEMGGMGAMPLPRPGSPEPLSGYVKLGGCGCGCNGKPGGCGGGVAGVGKPPMSDIGITSAVTYGAIALGGYVLYHLFFKKK